MRSYWSARRRARPRFAHASRWRAWIAFWSASALARCRLLAPYIWLLWSESWAFASSTRVPISLIASEVGGGRVPFAVVSRVAMSASAAPPSFIEASRCERRILSGESSRYFASGSPFRTCAGSVPDGSLPSANKASVWFVALRARSARARSLVCDELSRSKSALIARRDMPFVTICGCCPAQRWVIARVWTARAR